MNREYDPKRLPMMFREARERQHFTQAEVAEIAGLSADGYSKIERGVNGVPVDLIWPICDFRHIPRLDAMDAILPLFDCAVMGGKGDYETIRLETPEDWHLTDNGFLDGHTVRPRLLVSQSELEFGLKAADFVGLHLMHPVMFRAFHEFVQACAWVRAFGGAATAETGGDSNG